MIETLESRWFPVVGLLMSRGQNKSTAGKIWQFYHLFLNGIAGSLTLPLHAHKYFGSNDAVNIGLPWPRSKNVYSPSATTHKCHKHNVLTHSQHTMTLSLAMLQFLYMSQGYFSGNRKLRHFFSLLKEMNWANWYILTRTNWRNWLWQIPLKQKGINETCCHATFIFTLVYTCNTMNGSIYMALPPHKDKLPLMSQLGASPELGVNLSSYRHIRMSHVLLRLFSIFLKKIVQLEKSVVNPSRFS